MDRVLKLGIGFGRPEVVIGHERSDKLDFDLHSLTITIV